MANISFLIFRDQFIKYGCFNIHQVYMWNPKFDSNNLTRWVVQGVLIKLKREWFAFPDYLEVADFSRLIANKIYPPSYISTHTALSYYGMIPESVTDITSVSTQKTASFTNRFGNYSYQTVKSTLFFGFKPVALKDGRVFQIARPEKALLDFLYLNPIYNSEEDMLNLRLDDSFLTEELNKGLMLQYLCVFNNKILSQRINTIYKVYNC